jgi:hypothetical protein
VASKTPRERARRLWLWAGAAVLLGIALATVSAVTGASGAVGAVLGFAAPLAFVGAVLLFGLGANITSRRSGPLWIGVGIGVFWVSNSALYLYLARRADNELTDVPSAELIALLSALFTAGVAALVAGLLLVVVSWLVRPGRWHALNGPGGQS